MLKSNGKSENTIKSISYKLTQMAQNCNLDNPDEVKLYIANATHHRTKKPLDNATKQALLLLRLMWLFCGAVTFRLMACVLNQSLPLVVSFNGYSTRFCWSLTLQFFMFSDVIMKDLITFQYWRVFLFQSSNPMNLGLNFNPTNQCANLGD